MTSPASPDPLSGLLLVDKPSGHTSHDVVARIRSRFRIRKVGHGGTLDPMATGLLILLVGRATKLSDRVIGHDKTYEGALRLGIETDTQDAEGSPVATAAPAAVAAITPADLLRAFAALTGDIIQVPPMASAKKIDGVRLYKLARKGHVVERPPAHVHVHQFVLARFDPPDATFQVSCSKGTYVRTLAHDAGRALGVGAHLIQLRRTRIGPFSIAQATPLQTILDSPSLAPFLLPLDTPLD